MTDGFRACAWVVALAGLGVASGAPLRAATQFMGIEPGVSTRAQVERAFGRELKITDTLGEYTPTALANVSRVLVEYGRGNTVVDRMEVYFTTVQTRDFVVQALALGRPTSSVFEPRFREFHGAPLLLALNYAGAAADSGVVSVGYYSVESFNDVTARAAGATTAAVSPTPASPRPTIPSPEPSPPVPVITLGPEFTDSRADRIPLRLYWSESRGDNFTTATAEGFEAARMASYRGVRVESLIFAKQLHGSVPLKMYYNDKRGDSFTTATPEGEQTAAREGYRFGRIEGYVMPTRFPNSVPLKRSWDAARQDYFVTATAVGENDAIRAGYVFVRIEGWVLEATPVP